MWMIIETNIKGLGLEERRESFYIYNLDESEKHIFVYPDGDKEPTIEISKKFLKKILKYFNDKPISIKNNKKED